MTEGISCYFIHSFIKWSKLIGVVLFFLVLVWVNSFCFVGWLLFVVNVNQINVKSNIEQFLKLRFSLSLDVELTEVVSLMNLFVPSVPFEAIE